MTSQQQLTTFLAKYTPEVRDLAKRAIAKLRTFMPSAVEIVYDNYNALAIGFGPTERASDAVMSVALYPRWVNLFFLNGATLPDPSRVLKGSGTRVRHVVVERSEDLDRPEVDHLIRAALENVEEPFPSKRKLVIKSVSAKQRPRQPARSE